jgi:hypothetical protein
MSGEAIANGYAIGAALLAIWLVGRYPGFGAKTIKGAGGLVLCGCLLLIATGPAFSVARSAAGPVFALLAVDLPIFVFAFWAGLRLVRASLDLSLHS